MIWSITLPADMEAKIAQIASLTDQTRKRVVLQLVEEALAARDSASLTFRVSNSAPRVRALRLYGGGNLLLSAELGKDGTIWDQRFGDAPILFGGIALNGFVCTSLATADDESARDAERSIWYIYAAADGGESLTDQSQGWSDTSVAKIKLRAYAVARQLGRPIRVIPMDATDVEAFDGFIATPDLQAPAQTAASAPTLQQVGARALELDPPEDDGA